MEHFSQPTRPITTVTIKSAFIADWRTADGRRERMFRWLQAQRRHLDAAAGCRCARSPVGHLERADRPVGRTKPGTGISYARSLVNDTWGQLVRLTTDPKPDINPHVTVDSQRNIHVVWQAHPNNAGDIYYCKFDGTSWSQPLAVTSDAESDWFPRVAVDEQRHGVDRLRQLPQRRLRRLSDERPRRTDRDRSFRSRRRRITKPMPASPAAATAPCGSPGNREAPNWGKDVGYWLRRNNRNQGSSLGSTRHVKVACYRDGKLLAAPDVQKSLAEADDRPAVEETAMAVAGMRQGWAHLAPLSSPDLCPQRQRPRGQKGWVESVTTLSPNGWTPAVDLAASTGRISVFSRILPAQDGSLWVAYSSDARDPRNYHRPIQDVALITNVPAPPAESRRSASLPPIARPTRPPACRHGTARAKRDRSSGSEASA